MIRPRLHALASWHTRDAALFLGHTRPMGRQQSTLMMLMAEAHGGDVRLVAFMQYLRVVCVASAASLVAALAFHASGGPAPQIVWFPTVDWIELGKTLAVSFAASALGARLKAQGVADAQPGFPSTRDRSSTGA